MGQDAISIERIKTAHPKVRCELEKIYTEANNKLGRSRLRFAYVTRTFAEQTALFNKRPKVTNASAGQSFHNYGLAVDIVLLVDLDGNGTFESASWDTVKDWDKDGVADWNEVVQVFKKYGWEWGGDFRTFKDRPHFQKRFGHSWQSLKKLHDTKKVDREGFVLI